MKHIRRRAVRIWPLVLLLLALAGAYSAGRLYGAYTAAPSPTPAPEKVTSTVVLEEFTFHAIQLGAFETDAEARALSESYTDRGAAGYVLTDTRSRAIGAAYLSRADADKVRANLAEQGVDSYVYTVSAPRIELRVTAEPGLAGLIAQAHDAVLHAIDELSRLALELDRGSISCLQAQTDLTALSALARERYESLNAALSGRTHAATSGLMSELMAAVNICDTLIQQNTASAMAFSVKIKYNVIDMMQRHVRSMQMLIQPGTIASGAQKG